MGHIYGAQCISGSCCAMRALRASLLLYMPFTLMVIALRLDIRPSGLFVGFISGVWSPDSSFLGW